MFQHKTQQIVIFIFYILLRDTTSYLDTFRGVDRCIFSQQKGSMAAGKSTTLIQTEVSQHWIDTKVYKDIPDPQRMKPDFGGSSNLLSSGTMSHILCL